MIIGRKVEIIEQIWKATGHGVEKNIAFNGWVLDHFNGYIVENGQRIKAWVYLVMIDGSGGLTKICRPEDVNKILDVETLQKKLEL